MECNEIFLSELERTLRVDAEFYQKENLRILSVLKRKRLHSVSELFYISDGNHMKIADSFCNKGIPYYRGQDMHVTFIEESSPICIDSGTFYEPLMARSHLKKGDVLMSIVGTIGNSALVTCDGNATCSCKLAIIRSKQKDLMPEALLTFIRTKYGQNQIQKLKRGAVQMGFLLEDFSQLYIPVFSDRFLESVASIVEKARSASFSGTKTYVTIKKELLDALDFDKSLISTENISKKLLSETFGKTGRLDAEYYQPRYYDLEDFLNRTETKLLGDLVTVKKSVEPGSDQYGEIGIPFLRVSDLSENGLTEPSIRIPESCVPNIESLYPKKDSILLTKDGTVGIAYKLKTDAMMVTSGAILNLRVKNPDEILPDYLALVLNSEIVKLQAERDANGAIIKHWKPADIKKVRIPLLPCDVQRRLSDGANRSFHSRQRADKLMKIAVDAVEKAIEDGEESALKLISHYNT